MLPFSIISNTNVIVERTVQKIATTGSTTYVLYDTGELYSTGANNYGQLANGTINDDFKNWYKVDNFVDNFYCSVHSSLAMLLVQKGTNLFYAGSDKVIYGTSTQNVRLVPWLDISEYYEDSSSYIGDIQINKNALMLLIKNPTSGLDKLYVCGSSEILGTGVNSNNYSGTLVESTTAPSSISKIRISRGSGSHAGVLSTEGDLYMCGSYTHYVISSSINSGISYSYVFQSSGVYDFDIGNSNYSCVKEDGLYFRGYSTSTSPVGGSAFPPRELSMVTPLSSDNPENFNSIKIGCASTHLAVIPETIKCTSPTGVGLNSIGDGRNQTIHTLIVPGEIDGFYMGEATYIYKQNDEFYTVGLSNHMPPNDGSSDTYHKKIVLPVI